MHGHARMHLLARHSHLIPMDLFSQSSPNAFRNCRRSFRRARALRMYSRRLPTPITPTNAPVRRPFSSAQPGTGPAGSRTHAQRFTKHIDIPRRFRKRQRHAAHRPLAACARSAYRMLCYLLRAATAVLERYLCFAFALRRIRSTALRRFAKPRCGFAPLCSAGQGTRGHRVRHDTPAAGRAVRCVPCRPQCLP